VCEITGKTQIEANMELLSRKEELILMAIWKLGDSAYGITVKNEIEANTGVKWLFGSIYTPITKLFDRGLITKSEGIPNGTRGGRPKVYFRLTQDGKKALAATQELSKALWTDVPPITL
jgi:DNA-binding PadR family transcriptional regulator